MIISMVALSLCTLKTCTVSNNIMDSKEDKHLRKTQAGGLIEKRPHVPKMLWMKNRLQKNKSSGSPDLMDRVQTFLKQIAESNRQLEETAAKNPEAFDIENTDDCDDNVIEMSLAVVPVDRDSDEEESSDEESESDDAGYVDADGKFKTERRKRTGQLVQVLAADNQEISDDEGEESNEEEESNDVISQEGVHEYSNDSSDSESCVMKNSELKAQQQRCLLVEVISGATDEAKAGDVSDALQDDKHESDDLNNGGSDFTVDKFLSIKKKQRAGPLIEVLSPEDGTN